MPPGSPRAAPRSIQVLLLRVVLLVVCTVLLVLAYQALRTVLALREAQGGVTQLKQSLGKGDTRDASRDLDQIAGAAAVARAHSDGVLWAAATHVPLVGRNVRAVSEIAAVLDETSHAGLPAALRLYSSLSRGELREQDGRFDLAEVRALDPDLDKLETAATAGSRRLARLNQNGLLPPVSGVTVEVQEQFASLASTARSGRTVVALMPSMLGAEEERHYLLVVQNNAEIRATGGLPGSFSVLRARQGRIDLGGQKSGADFKILPRPVLPLTREEAALYGPVLGSDIRDTNLTPDFVRTARLMSAMYQRRYGEQLDGVISVDPVALSMVLQATGPVRVGGESFTSDNVLPNLLNRPYQELKTQRAQDAYFAASARDVFDTLLGGPIGTPGVVSKLALATSQGHLLLWSRQAEEQARLSGTAAAGELRGDEGGVPRVGLYLNDATGAKMQYYLRYSVDFDAVSCSPSGVQTLRTLATLRSKAPKDPAGLSPWVTGFGDNAPKGTMLMTARLYVPEGGSVTKILANGRLVNPLVLRHQGREVAVLTVKLAADEEVRLSAIMRTDDDRRGDPEIRWTPGMRAGPNRATAASACS